MKLFLALAAAALVWGTGAVAGRNPEAKPSGEAVLSPLARKYALKREAVLQEFAAKRRALLASPGWKALAPAKRKAALDALDAQAKAKDDGLIADYDAELRRGRASADADAASTEQARQRRLDELRAHAAQDALRAKKIP